MTSRIRGGISPQLAFLALAVVINVAVTLMTNAVTDPVRHQRVALAAVFDMTVTVTILYYWMVVRPGLRSWKSLFAIGFLALLRASFAHPDVVPGREWLAAGAEVALVAAVIAGVRQSRSLRRTDADAEPAERIRAVLAGLVPFSTVERALTAELSLLYYGFNWRAKPHVPAGAKTFTLHEKSGIGDIILFVGMASLLEVIPVHLVLAHWSHVVAWIMTGLSLYGAIWAFSLGRSFALLPALITKDEVIVRSGLLFTLRIPFGAIASFGRERVCGATILPRNTTPTHFIAFHHPLTALRVMGIRKEVRAVGLAIDDPSAFEAALRPAL